MTRKLIYQEDMPGAAHFSCYLPANSVLEFTDTDGGANVGMMFYNPINLGERYNAPDTLKCQHTFKLTAGNCVYSDMGRVFCSIVRDDTGWIDTVTGSCDRKMVKEKWGDRDYQKDRNLWNQNGFDSFLVELGKYGMSAEDMCMCMNLFSRVSVDYDGNLSWVENHSKAGDVIALRFEMPTLVIFHTCPHPLNPAKTYPRHGVHYAVYSCDPAGEYDLCRTHCPENQRGFENTRRYMFGIRDLA